MSIPNVDTFEHDIADEIKNKEATISDIASASGDIGSGQKTREGTNLFLILGGIFIFAVLGVLAGLFYFTTKGTPSISPLASSTPVTSTSLLFSLSPALADGISTSVKDVRKTPYGYTIIISSYTSAFAYMRKNESSYADEMALSLGVPRDTSTTTAPFSFTDITINNQNMRVGTSGSSTIIYAFVNAKAVVVSTSTQGILLQANDILQ